MEIYDEFGRTVTRRRSRSASREPEDRRVRQRRSIDESANTTGDAYIPNYDRDGYVPAPRYNHGRSNGGGPMYLDNHSDRNQDPLKLDYLVSFKYFAEFLRGSKGRNDSVEEELEVQHKYATYKEKFTKKSLKTFFEKHKNDEWFKEKYHPDDSKPLLENRSERKKGQFKEFIADLEGEKFDLVDFDDKDPIELDKSTTAADHNKEENFDDYLVEEVKDENGNVESKKQAIIKIIMGEAKLNSLFLKSIPTNLSRLKYKDLLTSPEGFKFLEVGLPNPSRLFHRIGWVVFEDDESAKNAITFLNQQKITIQIGEKNEEIDHTFQAAINVVSPPRIKTIPSIASSQDRLEVDYEQVKKLIASLDEEAGIEGGLAALDKRAQEITGGLKKDDVDAMDEDVADTTDAETKIITLKKYLDLHILYLRKVHNFDYYTGFEVDSPEDFGRRGMVCFRSSVAIRDGNPEKFFERLDSKIKLRSDRPLSDEEIVKVGGLSYEVETDKILSKFVKKESESKFRCTAIVGTATDKCSKLFKGEEFIKKHIKLKHHDLAKDVLLDAQYFNAYVTDPNKPQASKEPFPIGGGGGDRMQMDTRMGDRGGHMTNASMGYGGGNKSYGGGGHDYQNGGGGRRGGGGRGRGNHGRPPPPNRGDRGKDTRIVRNYVDLDFVAEGEVSIEY